MKLRIPKRGGKAGTATDEKLKPDAPRADDAAKADEVGGPKGLEPTRYGDWERKGICVDF